MSLDGFAMSNLGLGTEMTSAQMANQAEQLAKKESQFKIKDIEESAKDQGVKRKKEESENNQFYDGLEDKKDEAEETEEDNEAESSPQYIGNITEKDFENRDPKDFSVRINPKTGWVELINNKEDKILETISAKDLMGMVSNLDGASGILVNRKI